MHHAFDCFEDTKYSILSVAVALISFFFRWTNMQREILFPRSLNAKATVRQSKVFIDGPNISRAFVHLRWKRKILFVIISFYFLMLSCFVTDCNHTSHRNINFCFTLVFPIRKSICRLRKSRQI